jgi:hypothetical protein
MNTLLYSYLSVYHSEQNEPFDTRAQAGRDAGGEQEATSLKDFLGHAVLFLTAVLLVSLIAYAGFAVAAIMGLSVLP